jgi:cell division protein FtsW (lipid II flippase)
MLKTLFVSSGMRLRDNTTPELVEVNSNDQNSALRNIVLPILIALALLAISLAILYAFFRQFKQKRRANTTETNQQVVTVCIRPNKLTVSMYCWRHFFQPLILLYLRLLIFLLIIHNLCAKLHRTVGRRSRKCHTKVPEIPLLQL